MFSAIIDTTMFSPPDGPVGVNFYDGQSQHHCLGKDRRLSDSLRLFTGPLRAILGAFMVRDGTPLDI